MESWAAMQPGSAETLARRRFIDAVIAFGEEAGPENLERYLTASRALEDARQRPTPPKRRGRQAQTAATR